MEEQNIERQEEEVNIEIVDEPQEQVAQKNVDTDDELDKYTKNVSRRINKKINK
jgi:hypothetical protein